MENKSFLVTFETAVLEPKTVNNKIFTKVINFSGESFIVGRKPYDIIRHSCAFYGSSFSHSVQLSKEIIGNYLKLPIVIAHDYGYPCVFVPTLSPKSDLNVWFSMNAIDAYYPSEHGCMITLPHGESIQVSVSQNTISRQVAYANMLNNHFLKRMSNLLNTQFVTTRNRHHRKFPIH